MPSPLTLLRAMQRAAAYARLDAIEGAADMPNDRLASLAETTSGTVALWRGERGLPQPKPGSRRKVRDVS